MATKSQGTMPELDAQESHLRIRRVANRSRRIENSIATPTLRKSSIYLRLKRWSKLSRFVAFCLNFQGFSRDAVACIYVFVMLGLYIWVLISNQYPYVIKGWAAYRLGAGFKQFIKFLTRDSASS